MQAKLICHQCNKNLATNLLYFTHLYYDTRKVGIFHPQIICNDCKAQIISRKELFENKPVFVPFLSIAKMNYRQVMWLCSDKGKEVSELACDIWRKKLLHIKKYSEGVLNSWTNKMPMSI